MGEVELLLKDNRIVIYATIIIYGDAANDALAAEVAADIENHWNEPQAVIQYKDGWFSSTDLQVVFKTAGIYNPALKPADIYDNTNPRNNYYRIEEFAQGNISFVDGINSNTGYFKLENLLHNSTTAAHEFGHSIGLDHPRQLDIRGQGRPGIMYPRGTWVDPAFQYYPEVPPGADGGTVNPFTRKVLQADIDKLGLTNLNFDEDNFAILGGFTSVWHEKHQS